MGLRVQKLGNRDACITTWRVGHVVKRHCQVTQSLIEWDWVYVGMARGKDDDLVSRGKGRFLEKGR